jgi:hypothetical protein
MDLPLRFFPGPGLQGANCQVQHPQDGYLRQVPGPGRFVFVITYYYQEPWFSKLCPAELLEAGMPFSLLSEDIRTIIKYMFWIKMGILVFFSALSATSKRPFCRTVCPVGTIYSYFNNYSFYQMSMDDHYCTNCNRSQKVCPMDIRIYENKYSVDCTRCSCVSYGSILSPANSPEEALPQKAAA